MRHLATIRTIKEVRDIPGADKIKVAIIDGWECIFSITDGFKVGAKVVYLEVDSMVPPKPMFEFLKKYKYRIKTIRLRGQISQGLILPLNVLGSLKESYVDGSDVTEKLGITKYDPELGVENTLSKGTPAKRMSTLDKWLIKTSLGRYIFTKLLGKGLTLPFPDWIRKTDEERIQNLPELWDRINDEGEVLTVSEKLDGTSGTYFLKGNTFGVCSRNLWLFTEDNSYYWEIAKAKHMKLALLKIKHWLESTGTDVRDLVIQGEIVGPGIQQNKYRLAARDIYIFTVYVNGVRIGDIGDVEELIHNSKADLNTVPRLQSWSSPVIKESIVDFVNGCFSEKDLSTLGVTAPEGVVMRKTKDHISFKVLNPYYLLKE